MPKLTPKQIAEVADNLVSIARVIGDYIIDHQLSVKGKLGNLHAAILDEASKLYLLSAIEVGKEVHIALEELGDLTIEIQETYEKLSQLKFMLNIATAVLSIGTALAGGDLKAFVEAIKGLKQEINPEDKE